MHGINEHACHMPIRGSDSNFIKKRIQDNQRGGQARRLEESNRSSVMLWSCCKVDELTRRQVTNDPVERLEQTEVDDFTLSTELVLLLLLAVVDESLDDSPAKRFVSAILS